MRRESEFLPIVRASCVSWGSGYGRRCSAEIVILGVLIVCVPVKLSASPSCLYFLFLFFTLVFFRHPPKPSYICLAFKLQGHELLSAGDLGCAWNMWVLSTSGGSVSLVLGTLTGSFPTQVPVCLEARGMAQAFSSWASFDETLTNLLLLTTLTCSVASYYTYKHLSFLMCKMGMISTFRDSVEDEMR